MNPDFEGLIRGIAQDRNRTAFAALFRHFAPRVKSYLVRLGTDAPTADELMQDVMLTVWRRADSFDPAQAAVGTWIFTIARNKRIDRMRREKHPEYDPADPALVPDAPEAADHRVEAAQASLRLRRAIDRLPVEQADLLRLAYFEDKAHVTIATERGVPLGTVKSRLRLALGRLRKEMGDT